MTTGHGASRQDSGGGLFLYAVLVVAVGFFGAFFFFPLFRTLAGSTIVDGKFTLTFYKTLATNPLYTKSLLNSFYIGLCVTLLSAALGYAAAWLMFRFRFPGKALWGALMLAPMVLPPFVGAIGLKQALGKFGMVNSLLMQMNVIDPQSPIAWLAAPFWGVVILETLHLFPIMYLNISGSMALVDPTLEEAARSLGGRGWALFRGVTLPLILPGVFAGGAIVFIWAFTDLGTPLIFEYAQTAPVQIFNMVTQADVNPAGYALVMIVLIATALLFVAGRVLFGGKKFETVGFGRAGASSRRPGPAAQAAISLFFILLLGAALLPHLSVILVSFSQNWFLTVLPEEWTTAHYTGVFTHQLAFLSVRNSVFLSVGSTAVDLALGGAIAWVLARRRFRGRAILDASTMLPLAVPGVVLAFGYVGAFSGTFLDPRVNPFPLLVISYSVRRLPLVVRALFAGLSQVDRTIEDAASGLGAPPRSVVSTVTLPLVSAGAIGGAILAFAFAMLEVSDSLILAMEDRFYPITKAIYMLLGRLDDGANVAAAMGILGMLLLMAALALAQKLLGKRMGQIFRA